MNDIGATSILDVKPAVACRERSPVRWGSPRSNSVQFIATAGEAREVFEETHSCTSTKQNLFSHLLPSRAYLPKNRSQKQTSRRIT